MVMYTVITEAFDLFTGIVQNHAMSIGDVKG